MAKNMPGETYTGGLALNFYAEAQFEAENAESAQENHRIKARNLLRVLMMGWTPEWRNLLTWRTFSAVLVDRDHELTQAMRHAFQQGFDHVYTQLEDKHLTEQEKAQADLYISNCLTYLPFADMSPYESISIPQYVDGSWQRVDYKVTPIELTPTYGFKKLFLAEHDRVFAYGLEPIHNPNAESHLIFMGTTYPAGQGFFTTVNTDLEAFETAGKKLYRTGRANITRWLDQQKHEVHVCGTSLGGALTELLALDKGGDTFENGATFSRFDALNPPGLYHPFRKSKFDNWDTFETKPPVYIQKQADDVISWFGIWKPDWHVLQVTPPADKKGPNGVADHAINYAGFAETEFTEVDASQDNESRKTRNWWLYAVLRSFVYYTFLVPIRYLVLPPVRFVFNHKIQLLLTGAFVPLFKFFPVIPLYIPISFALNTLLPAVITGYLLSTIIHYVTDCITGKSNSDISKLLAVLKKQPLWSIPIVLLSAAIIASVVSSLFLFPAWTTTLTLAFAAIPVVVAVLGRTIDIFQILFGYNHVQPPNCHAPSLNRNENLDIYSNTNETQVTFSYGQMHDYYQAKRTMKGKPFPPAEEVVLPGGAEPRFFKGTQETKLDIILKGRPEELTRGEAITFFATKAKAHDMKRTLGLDLAQDQSEVLRQHQQEYTAGKLRSF